MIDKFDHNGFVIEIDTDDFSDSPRDWDNLGTIIAFHSRYNLGDEGKFNDPDDAMINLIAKCDATRYEYYQHRLEYSGKSRKDLHQEIIEHLEKFGLVILPVYMYDHGGITINTIGFGCPWDSGQLGWIYVTKETWKKEFGWKRLTQLRREQLLASLRNEIDTYDKFLRNDTYAYRIYDQDENMIDNCCGFYDEDECINEAMENCPKSLKIHNVK